MADLGLDAIGIVDADGHVLEDFDEILKILPEAYSATSFLQKDHARIFPGSGAPISALGIAPEGSVERSGPEGWASFLDQLSVQAAVIYPTYGLSVGWLWDPNLA